MLRIPLPSRDRAVITEVGNGNSDPAGFSGMFCAETARLLEGKL
jgi:hypothetical protein